MLPSRGAFLMGNRVVGLKISSCVMEKSSVLFSIESLIFMSNSLLMSGSDFPDVRLLISSFALEGVQYRLKGKSWAFMFLIVLKWSSFGALHSLF